MKKIASSKKKIGLNILVFAILVAPFLLATMVMAGGGLDPKIPDSPGTVPTDGPYTIFGKVIKVLFWVILLAAVIFILIAGFLFVTASGDEDKTKTARNYILYAIIGIIVAIAAQGLVAFIQKEVGSA